MKASEIQVKREPITEAKLLESDADAVLNVQDSDFGPALTAEQLLKSLRLSH